MSYQKFWIACGASLVMLLSVGSANAGTVESTKVSWVRVAGSVLNVSVASNVSGSPSCSTHGGGRTFALDLTSPGAEEMARLLSAALLADRNVKIVGSGTCSVHSNKETMVDLYLY